MRVFATCLTIVVGVCLAAHLYKEEPAPAPVVIVTLDTVPKPAPAIERLRDAISTIESRSNPLARRFERHLFERRTGIAVTSYAQACRINERVAMLCTSWGKYQILGSNYKAAGFRSVYAMASATEQEQDSAFARFARRSKLGTYAERNDWHRIARIYNGRNYSRNRYAEKLAAAMKNGENSAKSGL